MSNSRSSIRGAALPRGVLIQLALAVVDEDRGLGVELILGESGGGLGGGLDEGHSERSWAAPKRKEAALSRSRSRRSRECTRETRQPVTKATRK